MPDLQFCCLGPLEVTRDGVPVPVPHGRSRALLGLLLLQAGRVVATECLLDQVWRGAPPAGANHVLQVHVAGLRKLLEPGRPRRSAAEVLITRPPGYTLAIDVDQNDAARFEALARAGENALTAGRPAEASRALGEALALWRGPLLADLRDEPFVANESLRMAEVRSVATEHWCEAELALRRHDALVGTLQDLVREHPYRERLWAHLMTALYRSGRASDALAAFQRLRTVLRNEMGATPCPELLRLETAVLRHDPVLLGPHRTGADVHIPHSTPPPLDPAPTLPHRLALASTSPLVGRTAERAMIAAAWEQAEAGTPTTVLVSGEHGVGKTHLVAQAAREVASGGGLVCYADCDIDADLELQPLLGALPHLLRSCPPQIAADVIGRRTPAFRARLPRVAADCAPPPASVELDRAQVIGELVDLLVDLSTAVPVALVLDNLHAASPGTICVVKALLGTADRAGLLIVGIYRDSDLEPAGAASGLVADPSWVGAARCISLTDLAPPEVARMIAARSGSPTDGLDPAVVGSMCAETGGNPFYIDAVLAQERRSGTGVPDTVRRAVLHRVFRLPARVSELLFAAAGVGPTPDVTGLCELTNCDPLTALNSLEEARRHGLLERVGEDPDRYRFTHPIVRTTLMCELGEGRRRYLGHRADQANAGARRQRNHLSLVWPP